MRRESVLLGLLIAGVTVLSRPALACTCASSAPRLLVPMPNTVHRAGAPLVIGADAAVTPFLYDPSGKLVKLRLLNQAGSLGDCLRHYYVYTPDPSIWDTTGEFTLLLSDDHSPNVVTSFTTASNMSAYDVATTAALQIERRQLEPFSASTGMCAPLSLDGVTISAEVTCTITLPSAAPVFIEAFYDDPVHGRVQDLRSTIAMSTDPTAPAIMDKASLVLPLIAGSGDCIEVRLYTWTFAPIWSSTVCSSGDTLQSYAVQFEMQDWNLSDDPATAPWRPDAYRAECGFVRPNNRSGALLWCLACLLLRGGRRSQCASHSSLRARVAS